MEIEGLNADGSPAITTGAGPGLLGEMVPQTQTLAHDYRDGGGVKRPFSQSMSRSRLVTWFQATVLRSLKAVCSISYKTKTSTYHYHNPQPQPCRHPFTHPLLPLPLLS